MIWKSIKGDRMSHCTSFSGSTSQNIDVDDWYLTENYYVLKTGSTQNVETCQNQDFPKMFLDLQRFHHIYLNITGGCG